MESFLMILSDNNINKNSEFDVTFDKPINLQHQFECALSEINFPTELDLNNIEEEYIINLEFDFFDWDHILPKEQNKLDLYFFKKKFKFKFTNIVELKSELDRVTSEMKTYIRDAIKNLFNLNFSSYKSHGWLDYPKIYIDNNILIASGGGLAIPYGSAVWDTYAKSFIDNNIPLENTNEIWPHPIYFQVATWTHMPFNVTIPQNLFKVLIIKDTFNFPSWGMFETGLHKYPFTFRSLKLTDIIFIYCNIVKHSYVGNTKSNILRVFKRLNKSRQYNFQNLLYVPLRIEEINSIKISCRDNLGDIVKFSDGNISLTLLFRPIEHI